MVVNDKILTGLLTSHFLVLESIRYRTHWFSRVTCGVLAQVSMIYLFSVAYCQTYTFCPFSPQPQTEQAFCGLWGYSDVRTGIQPQLLAPEPCTLGEVTSFLFCCCCELSERRPSDREVRCGR